MDSSWKTVSIGDVCDAIYDGPHATPRKTTDGPIFLGISNLQNGQINLSDAKHLSEEDFIKWTRRVTPKENDIVFSYETRLGEAALVPNGLRFCLGRRMALMRPNTNKVVPRFLLYAFRGPEFQQTLRERTVYGSTVNRIPLIEFPSFPISLPSIPEQHAIAEILGALDDKIELNRRMNRTLESMARAVYGEMMKGENGSWIQGSILDFANLLSGGTPSTAEERYWNGDIEWVSAKDVGNVDGIFLLNTEKKITQAGVDNSSTKLLPAKTTIVTARGTVGAHCILGKPMTMNQTNYGLKAKEGIGDYFIYFTLSEMVEQLKQQSYGTIFDTITTKTFQSALCIHPPIDFIHKFEFQVTPLMDAILNNQRESCTLASLRDTLLPKLMKGEVGVSAL